MGHVALQQQLRLEAELAPLGLGREVREPLVLQALRGAHPAAAGGDLRESPALLPHPQGPFVRDKETAPMTERECDARARDPDSIPHSPAGGVSGITTLLALQCLG